MGGSSFPWLSLFILGAAHGINPAMGWLFAVGRGLERRDRFAVWRALGPLALGHALAITVAVLLALALGRVVPAHWLRWAVAAALAAAGVDGLVRHRHVSLGGMRVGAGELATWSFLMASAHGAGLMVLPFVLGAASHGMSAMPGHDHAMPVLAAGASVAPLGIAAPVIHTAGYLAATAVLAVVVYEKVGVGILRRAWINVNVLWAAALLVSGVATALI